MKSTAIELLNIGMQIGKPRYLHFWFKFLGGTHLQRHDKYNILADKQLSMCHETMNDSLTDYLYGNNDLWTMGEPNALK